jgi:hypothetical protein
MCGSAWNQDAVQEKDKAFSADGDAG